MSKTKKQRKNVAKEQDNIVDAWRALFIENERLARQKSTSPMTDPELIEMMEDAFPDRQGKSTVTRVSMYRLHYNAGRWSMAKHGAPDGSADRPFSFAYDADGTAVGPRNLLGKSEAERKAWATEQASKADADAAGRKAKDEPAKAAEPEAEDQEPKRAKKATRKKASKKKASRKKAKGKDATGGEFDPKKQAAYD